MEIYGREHAEKFIKVILGQALDHLSNALDLVNNVTESLDKGAVNYLAVEIDLLEAVSEVARAYDKCGGPESVALAEIFEPTMANLHMALIMFQGCFHEWKSGKKPPGLTTHACYYISQELESGKAKISQANDLIFDKMSGLAETLKEVETIRFTSPG